MRVGRGHRLKHETPLPRHPALEPFFHISNESY